MHAENKNWPAVVVCSNSAVAHSKSNQKIVHTITKLFTKMPLSSLAELWATSIEEAEKPAQFSSRDGHLLKRIPNGLKRNQLKDILQITFSDDNDLASCVSGMLVGQSESIVVHQRLCSWYELVIKAVIYL